MLLMGKFGNLLFGGSEKDIEDSLNEFILSIFCIGAKSFSLDSVKLFTSFISAKLIIEFSLSLLEKGFISVIAFSLL